MKKPIKRAQRRKPVSKASTKTTAWPLPTPNTDRALKARGPAHNLIWVRDGVQALEFLFGPEHPARAKLLHKSKISLRDLKLPKVNGLEVLRRVKSDPDAKTIPIVMLKSSLEKPGIVKPVDFDRFAHAIAQL